MPTHAAVVTVAPGASLQIHQVPTPVPQHDEIRVRALWTASTPLDLHQADGGLLVSHPQVLGDGIVGPVVEIGPAVTKYKVGDVVFGFTWRNQAEKGHQEFVVAPEYLFGRLPENVSMQEAVTLPNNFVTAWHTLTADLGFELPWPKPSGYIPKEKDEWILIWGGSSSVGQFALQILRYYGYTNLITTAGKAHHAKLRGYGAAICFDYRDRDVEKEISTFAASQAGSKGISYVLDCIGSLHGSVLPISRMVSESTGPTTPSDAKVIIAILLPIILRDAAPGVAPQYEMDTMACAAWPPNTNVIGVRTHYYLDNTFLKDKLQSEIMPELLGKGFVEANDQMVVEGSTLLERAEKALGVLRARGVSGKRLVWRVSDED
jgi:NADPH:quinone reductase-like Zn-dependent oxidoreductase